MAKDLLQTIDHYHSKKVEEILTTFNSSTEGLSSDQANNRLQKYGLNEIQQGKKINPIKIFVRQLTNLMVAILVIAAILSAYYNHLLDTAVIAFVILLNSVIGFIQEYKAETAIAALKKLVVQKAKVRRDGQIIEIPANQVVPGDVIILEEGDKVPADARIISLNNALTSESLLTGESNPVSKDISLLPYETTLAERKNMVFSGTILVRGSVEAIVVATGKDSVLGGIAVSLGSIEKSSAHFQKKNNQLVKQMSAIAFAVASFTFLAGFFLRGIPFDEILPFTLAALVSGIPESLPIIVIVILSLSAHRMAKRNAIVRTLPATETLSVVDIIITDKTGTLTQNKMTATKVKLSSQKAISKLVTIAHYCNNIHLQKQDNEEPILIGDPTEIAFYMFAKDNKEVDIPDMKKTVDFPFNQQLKVRASVVKSKDGYELFVVGAPETIFAKSTLNKTDLKIAEQGINDMTNDAMRTIAFAYKKLKENPKEINAKIINKLTWVGSLGLIDPPREESTKAIAAAKRAGIRVIMATGDHPKTALAIAKQIRLTTNTNVLTASDVEAMTDQELLDAADTTDVFARMTPDAKLRLAQVLQKAGHTIAMTGDGVNDAPSLKNADIGIAMGKVGTDVSREAADIILADDNFATIVAAIEEGRTQFRNIRRTSFFLVTTNLAEGASLLAFLVLGLPLPLLPKQILWLNLVGSGVTDVALATEDIHEDVLSTPPRSRHESILNKSMLPLLLLLIVTMTIAAIVTFLTILPQGESKARTAVFVVLSLMQIVNMFNMRSLKRSVFSIGIFNNRNINMSVVASVALLLCVVYIPLLANLFEFVPLSPWEFGILAVAALLVLVLGEFEKKYLRKKVLLK